MKSLLKTERLGIGMKFPKLLVVCALFFAACDEQPVQQEAQAFLDSYSSTYLDLYYTSSLAEWNSNTRIIEGDTTNAAATRAANEALAAFTGSVENIEKARALLQQREKLTPLQEKQLEKILYLAANSPQTVPDLVKARIKAETEQTEKLYGHRFTIDGKEVSANEIDAILDSETDLQRRLAAWEASKEVGRAVKDGLVTLQGLRNKTVQALGYEDYFAYQVSDYGTTTAEMVELMNELNRQIRPLYRELHTYARYELAKKYGAEDVPAMLPAHWLPNRWGQDWSAMITVQGMDIDGALQNKSAEWLNQQGERFYTSIGFPPLPASYWEKSSLYPLPPDAGYKKNNHASAWHLNLQDDVRCLMSVVPNARWYETVHHELGHIYYYISYTNPDVPPLLREGANRAFHEGVGSLLGLAAMQRPFLAEVGVLPDEAENGSSEELALLKEALNYIVFIPWSAGVMTLFEHELYANELPPDQFNRTWWDLKQTYQGIVPPAPRDETFCDAGSKTHISNDAAQYYDYALSYVILFQLHDHIASKILEQNPRATNYYDNQQVGEFLRSIMQSGSSRDWREVLRATTGESLNASAMLNYFAPLMAYLQKVNQGRTHTLEEI